jgi:carboxyl-terminal processing protease
VSGSSAYVPKEPEKDKQLQYALSFLRGTAIDAKTAGATVPKPTPAPAAKPDTDSKDKGKGKD